MPYSAANDPLHWLHRAEEARTMAENLSDPSARTTMLEIAAAYEQMGKKAVRQILFTGREAPKPVPSSPTASLPQPSARALWSVDHMIAYVLERTKTEMMTIQFREGKRLRLAGSYGFKRPFLDFFDVVTDDDPCACGTAVGSKRQVVVSDTSVSPIFSAASLKVIEAAGVRSVVSTPLISGDNTVGGMLAIHRSTPWYPSSAQICEINTICHNLSLNMSL